MAKTKAVRREDRKQPSRLGRSIGEYLGWLSKAVDESREVDDSTDEDEVTGMVIIRFEAEAECRIGIGSVVQLVLTLKSKFQAVVSKRHVVAAIGGIIGLLATELSLLHPMVASFFRHLLNNW